MPPKPALKSTQKPKPLPKTKSKKPEKPPKSIANTIKNQDPVPPIAPPHEPLIGSVTILFNHYHDNFEIRDGMLQSEAIDDKYAFSFVHKGNFKLLLHDTTPDTPVSPITGPTFSGLVSGKIYTVEVIEDPVEQARLDARPTGHALKFATGNSTVKGSNTASKIITEQLKGLTEQQLLDKGDEYRNLLEQRDLEDCLYG